VKQPSEDRIWSPIRVGRSNQSPVIVHPTANNDASYQSWNFNLEHYDFVIMT